MQSPNKTTTRRTSNPTSIKIPSSIFSPTATPVTTPTEEYPEFHAQLGDISSFLENISHTLKDIQSDCKMLENKNRELKRAFKGIHRQQLKIKSY